MREKLNLGRYDYAAYLAFTAYAMCSLAIPLIIVEMGKTLHFPLDDGGMAAGGVLHLVRSVGIMIMLLLCGIIAGRIGKRSTMGFAMVMMGCGILFCSIMPEYFLLIPCLLLAGLGEGLCEGIATPFVQDLHENAPERYVNITHSLWSVGTFLCVMLSGVLLTLHVSWRIILAVCGVLGLLAAVLFIWKEDPLKKYPEKLQKETAGDIWRYTAAIGKNGRFWVFCFGMFMGAGAEFCLTFWSAAYLELTFGASAWIAGLGTGAIAAGMFVSRAVFGYFARKEYLKHLLLACSAGTIPLIILLAYLKSTMFPSETVLFTVLLFILFLCGIGVGPFWPTLQVYGVNQLPELDSTMLYIYFSAMGIPGCGFFTWIMGVLGDHFGLRGAFLMLPVSTALYALAIFLEGWVFPKRTAPESRS